MNPLAGLDPLGKLKVRAVTRPRRLCPRLHREHPNRSVWRQSHTHVLCHEVCAFARAELHRGFVHATGGDEGGREGPPPPRPPPQRAGTALLPL